MIMQEIDVFERFDYEHADENVAFVGAALRAGVKPVFKAVNEDFQETIHTEIISADMKLEPVISEIELDQQLEPVSQSTDSDLPIYKEEEVELADDETEELNLTPESKELLSCKTEAQLLSRFCETAIMTVNDSEAKLEAWQQITEDYNNGRLLPELYQMRGKRTERSLRKWVDAYLENSRDMYALIHKSKNQNRGRKVSYLEQHFLLKLLLSPQKIKIGSAIATLKSYARLGSLESPSSIPTLRRWCEDYRRNNPAIWTQARQGSKAVAEEIVKTIKRDNELLRVGQVWVADGHTLSFDIINPNPGKAQRMTMIMVLDWASRYPVGASLAYTEDSQHIQLAFRNGFLNWGGVPKFVYLDNGKAFRSKLFNERWADHDLATELSGIFPRLGIGVVFAESYNAKAKIIERFFKTFQERFERFISSFRGSTIADKPSTLMRNEKWAQKLYKAEPPTLEEAMQMIGFFIRYIYGEDPHSGLGGKTPWSVFKAAEVPENQKVEPKRLNYLMMATVRKTLRNNGIILNMMQYWSTELIDHMGKEVLIRYDMADLRWILVYDLQDNYICQAEVRRAQDPFVHLDKSNPISQSELNKEYREIKRYHKQIERRTKLTVRKSSDVVEKLVRPLLMSTSNPTFIQPPMLEALQPGPEQEIARLEQIVIHEQHPVAQEVREPMAKLEKLEAEVIQKQSKDDSDNQAWPIQSDISLKEMLNRIGVERK
jgi:putative transposase